jgi:hypothetical protein
LRRPFAILQQLREAFVIIDQGVGDHGQACGGLAEFD